MVVNRESLRMEGDKKRTTQNEAAGGKAFLICIRGNRGMWLEEIVLKSSKAAKQPAEVEDGKDETAQLKVCDFVPRVNEDIRFSVFSNNGKWFVYYTRAGIRLVDLQAKTHIPIDSHWGDTSNIRKIAFSPKDTYLALWEMQSMEKESYCRLIRMDTLEQVAKFNQFRRAEWQLSWREDEQLLARYSNTELIFHQDSDFEKIVQHLPKNVRAFSVCPKGSIPYVAVFHKGKEETAFLRIYKFPEISRPEFAVAARQLSADDVKLLWNDCGSHVIACATSEVDNTGNSYYGTMHVILFSIKNQARSDEPKSRIIQLDKEGPVHAVKWCPSADSFVITYGSMPNITGIFNLQGEVIFKFKTNGYTNGILFNQFGNILCLYGNGNMRSSLAFWDTGKPKNFQSLKKSIELKMDMTHIEWAPDGIHMIIKTLSPRIRIDNKFQLIHFSGHIICSREYEKEMYQASVRPIFNTFTRPSPRKAMKEASSANGGQPTQDLAAKTLAYVPPHLRSRVTPSAPKPLGESTTMSSNNNSNQSARQRKPALPVGMTAPPAAKSRKKKKAKAGAATQNTQKNNE